MQPVISPRWRNRWNLTAAQWATAQAQFATTIYPSGLIATGVDSVDANFTLPTTGLPTGCARADRYTVTQPGGRICTEPQHAYLLYPTASAVGKLLVWMGGHIQFAGKEYLQTDGSAPVIELLKLGWHVLCVPMWPYDWDSFAATVHITFGGILTAISGHALQPLDGDSGPCSARIFTDAAIRATTTAIAALSPSKAVLGGHSGGATTCGWVGALDSRFSGIYWLNGGLPLPLSVPTDQVSDYELSIRENIVYTGAPKILGPWGALMLAAAYSGRRWGVRCSVQDEYYPVPSTQQPSLYEQIESLQYFTCPVGASGSYLLDTTSAGGTDPYHSVTIAATNWMLADIAAHF